MGRHAPDGDPRSAVVLTFVADWLGLIERRTHMAQPGWCSCWDRATLVGDAAGSAATLVYLGLAQLVAGRSIWPRARLAGTTRHCWPAGSR